MEGARGDNPGGRSLGLWAGRVLAMLAAMSAVVLILLDLTPGFTSRVEHTFVSATPLAAVALANLAYQLFRRPDLKGIGQAILLSAAFGFWALYQLLPSLPVAPVFNDLAIALFVLDVTLIVVSRRQKRESL